MSLEIQRELKNRFALDQASMIPLKQPLTIEFYRDWLAKNYHGSMKYLEKHLPLKANPRALDASLNSVITVTQNYFPAPQKTRWAIPARTSLYAKNDDYHFWLKEKLRRAIEWLEPQFPGEIFLPYVDSGPILEKDYGYQAGHGWFGKNSCLIHPKKGSLFFVAEILTSLKTTDDDDLAPLPDMCGSCTRCIDTCPTGAIVAPKIIKADQCISYLTIESKTVPPLELRERIGDWFFGCDICQTVCPWNQKIFRSLEIEKPADISTDQRLNLNTAELAELMEFLRKILISSNKDILRMGAGTALHRAGGFGLKRNALIVIANRKLPELREEVRALINHVKLGELARWCLAQISEESR